MQKSVLAEIIRSLSKKEIRDISKWLQSPAHNQRQDVIGLFDFLTKTLTDGDESAEKEQAWAFVFPTRPYDDAYMRQVMYFLLKSIEEYLLFVGCTSDKVQYQIGLARIYRRRKLEKAYLQAHRMGIQSLEAQPLRNDYYLLNKFFLEQEEYERKMSVTQNAPVNLQETADALEKWFVAEKLLVVNEMLAHHNIYRKADYDFGLLEEVLAYASRQNLLEEPTIAAYYYAYKAITTPNEEQHFDEFERLILEKSESIFNISEARNLYVNALNYCTAKVNQGNLDYCRRALKFYRSGVENGILLENNTISRYTFGNAVAFAVKIKEFGWAEQFIEKYQHFLEEKHRNSTVNFNLSRVYFERGDYDKAQELLTQFEYDYMYLNIIAKTMLLKIYYEKEEFDALESLLESMRIYLQRKEALDPNRKAAYKNMISLMKKLVNLNPYAKGPKEKLRELIISTNPLMERDWLMRQLDEKGR